ncbi:hypothetical protein SSP35_14_00290 [Streptomyces sp. NBRC 110611]|uniref:hypothetical protein n=1 Tax=Streptomyces sp. NBRC 110611 TaxID=1621259 RepID=UPI000834C18C|nr:hypothetical protein [Streptomyces sp. NBRC 110611]GAU69695.1 hypothetical protein SSP35_14_00290 [Streptomyces sp. NBRC 110611]
MSLYCPAPLPYDAAPDDQLAPPRAEDRLDTLALPVDLLLPPPRPQDRLHFAADPEDGALPPPRPEERLRAPLALADRRRLDIQAALTAAGVAPAAGDAAAVAELAGLSETTVRAVIDWIESAAETSWARPCAR